MREMATWVLKAHEGKASDVGNFLPGGKMLVDDKPETVSWHAIQPGNNTYAIFDTFAGNDGRDAHLNAKVADALVENAPEILEGFSAKTTDRYRNHCASLVGSFRKEKTKQ